MKIAANATRTTTVLAEGRLELAPKGDRAGKDRKEISDELAKHPDIVRFADLGKISLMSLPEAGEEKLRVAAAKAAAPVIPFVPDIGKTQAEPEQPKATMSGFKPADALEDDLPPESQGPPDPPPESALEPNVETKTEEKTEEKAESKYKAGDKKSSKKRRNK